MFASTRAFLVLLCICNIHLAVIVRVPGRFTGTRTLQTLICSRYIFHEMSPLQMLLFHDIKLHFKSIKFKMLIENLGNGECTMQNDFNIRHRMAPLEIWYSMTLIIISRSKLQTITKLMPYIFLHLYIACRRAALVII